MVSVWSNIILVNKHRTSETVLSFFAISIILLSIYSIFINIIIQAKQLCNKEHKKIDHKLYLMLHLLSPTLTSVTVVYERLFDIDSIFWQILSWTTIFLWLRFILFMRSHERLSPYISMLVQNFKGTQEFVLIFIIGVFVFADSFKSIKLALHDDDVIHFDHTKFADVTDFSSWKNAWFRDFREGFRSSFYTALGSFSTIEVG